MRLPHRRFLHLAGVAAAVAILSVTVTGHGAWSQTARTIKVVVPVQPGGGIDFLARVLGEGIGRAQGPTMVIENRPGAGSIIGTEAVSHAAPDGNTLLIVLTDLLIGPHLRKLNFDPLTSLEPICYGCRQPALWVRRRSAREARCGQAPRRQTRSAKTSSEWHLSAHSRCHQFVTR